jgi:4-hydroxy-tetrahydrodipicolinate synthase
MSIQGTITALITPFCDQKLDEEGLAENIRFQINQGVDGILVLGTTGESSTLTWEEQREVISIAVQEAKGHVPIWVGTGANNTLQAIEKTNQAKELGADIALIVTPYYNKPTQEGIFRHFEAISAKTDIPIVIYNIPGRTGTNIETHTLLRIAELPNIIGVKEASGNLNQAGDVLHGINERQLDLVVLSGDDALTLPMMALGAKGVISVVSNLIPSKVCQQVDAALKGRYDQAQHLHYELLPLYKVAFLETNPVPIKTAMNLCGMPAGECRLPLYQMSEHSVAILAQVLRNMGLLRTPSLCQA